MSFTTETLSILELNTRAKWLYFVLAIAITFSYGLNIVKLNDCDFEYPYKAEAMRFMGILPPVGIVVAWIDVGE